MISDRGTTSTAAQEDWLGKEEQYSSQGPASRPFLFLESDSCTSGLRKLKGVNQCFNVLGLLFLISLKINIWNEADRYAFLSN